MVHTGSLLKDFHQYGRVWLRNAMSADEVDKLKTLSTLGNRPGARIAQSDPLFKAIDAAPFNAKIRALWSNMTPVRLVSFDKNPRANWGVPWHQDRVVAVKDRVEVPGFSNWSRKADAWHCEPPAEMLERMLFVRLHLDASTQDSGAMEIALGSHRLGKLPAEMAAATAERYKAELTLAAPGDVLVLAMLTLHR